MELIFEDLDGPAEVKDPSRAKVEIVRQEHGVPREASLGEDAIPRDEVPISKVKKDRASGSLTTKGSKSQLYGSDIEKKEKTLQGMMRKLELMLKEQKEYAATLREEYHRQTPKLGQTSGNDDA